MNIIIIKNNLHEELKKYNYVLGSTLLIIYLKKIKNKYIYDVKSSELLGEFIYFLSSIQHELENDFVRTIPIVNHQLMRELKLAWSSKVVFSPIAFAFLNHLVGQFAELVHCRARQQGHLFRGDHGKLIA